MSLRYIAVCLLLTGCVHEIPPPATPAEIVPDVGVLPTPEEGNGHVIVDVEDGPTDVRLLLTRTVELEVDKGRTIVTSSTTTESLCVSPCVAELPVGRYVLGFPTRGASGRLELDDVALSLSPTVYRRALGSYESAGAGKPLGIVAVTFGGMSFVTGAALLPVGLATDDNDGLIVAGGITLAAGAILTALGIYGIASSPTTVQPGSSVQFALPAD